MCALKYVSQYGSIMNHICFFLCQDPKPTSHYIHGHIKRVWIDIFIPLNDVKGTPQSKKGK